MSLASPALNNTAVRRKVTKVTKAQQEELERGWRARNIWLRDLGLPKESLEQYTEWVYGRGKKTKKKEVYGQGSTPAISRTTSPPKRGSDYGSDCGSDKTQFEAVRSSVTNIPSETPSTTAPMARWTTGPCSTKPSPTYTGTKMIGIGTLHKSNAVPIFSNEEAIDIARMRR